MKLGLSSSSVSTLRDFERMASVYQQISSGTEHTENENIQLQTVCVICLPHRMDKE